MLMQFKINHVYDLDPIGNQLAIKLRTFIDILNILKKVYRHLIMIRTLLYSIIGYVVLFVFLYVICTKISLFP